MLTGLTPTARHESMHSYFIHQFYFTEVNSYLLPMPMYQLKKKTNPKNKTKNHKHTKQQQTKKQTPKQQTNKPH